MTLTFDESVKAFRAVQEQYAARGACDTEPRSLFVEMVVDLAHDNAVKVPNAKENGWDLYSSTPGWLVANQALSRAARNVLVAGRKDREGMLAWLKNEYGIEI